MNHFRPFYAVAYRTKEKRVGLSQSFTRKNNAVRWERYIAEKNEATCLMRYVHSKTGGWVQTPLGIPFTANDFIGWGGALIKADPA